MRQEKKVHPARIEYGARLWRQKNSAARARRRGRLERERGVSLDSSDGEHLAAAVVPAGGANAVRARSGSAVVAAAELAGVPAVSGLASTQAHFGHFSFWNSHKTKSRRLRLKLEAVQRIPHWSRLFDLNGFLGWQLQSRANFQTGPIAVRVGRKGEDNVFPERLCQVCLFRSS